MTNVDTLLKRSLDVGGDAWVLTLDPVFQGLPGAAHGGSVLAMFDALAKVAGPRTVSGAYHKRVPIGVPLTLAQPTEAGGHRFVISDAEGVALVSGRVEADQEAPPRSRPMPGEAGHPLPISRTCFVCGTDNPMGLRAHLVVGGQTVSGTWTAPAPFRDDNGALATAALTSLLDEAAFWLGALATGESGMTTDLRVALHRSVTHETAITVVGSRGDVQPHPDDQRYLTTAVAAHDPAGDVIASARITFVAVRGAARRLVSGMLSINDPDIVRRVFPAYVAARA